MGLGQAVLSSDGATSAGGGGSLPFTYATARPLRRPVGHEIVSVAGRGGAARGPAVGRGGERL